MRAPIWLACFAMGVVSGHALAAGASVEFAVALAELERVGRSIAKDKCMRPLEVKTQFVRNPRAPDATEEMQSFACRGFRVAVYRTMIDGMPRELPMSVVIEAANALLSSEWSVGATAASVRARLGAPHSSVGETLSYSLSAERAGRDTLTFEVEGGIVRAVTWNWDVD